MRFYQPSLGTDAEFVVVDKGRAVPACTVLPNQSSLFPIHCRPFNDGRQGEFTTAPQECRHYVNTQIDKALVRSGDVLSDQGLSYKLCAAMPMDIRDIKAAGRKAIVSGCNPDYNCYTEEKNPPVEGFENNGIVMCGTHLHVQRPYDSKCFLPIEMARICDVLVGLPMTALLNYRDEKVRRENGRGQAGNYRCGNVTFEYRPLSGNAIRHPAFVSLAFAGIRIAWNLCVNDYSREFLKEVYAIESEDYIRDAINECRVEASYNMFERIVEALATRYWSGQWYDNPYSTETGYESFLGGGTTREAPLEVTLRALEGGGKTFIDTERGWRLDRSLWSVEGVPGPGWMDTILGEG